MRLVGADDHVYPNFLDVMQWLAESNLLEMIVDKLSPSVSGNCCIFIFGYIQMSVEKLSPYPISIPTYQFFFLSFFSNRALAIF